MVIQPPERETTRMQLESRSKNDQNMGKDPVNDDDQNPHDPLGPVPAKPQVLPDNSDYHVFEQHSTLHDGSDKVVRTLILSVENESPPSFAANVDQDLFIYTENLTLSQSVTTNGSDIGIFTHSLQPQANSKGNSIKIDASGPDGTPVQDTILDDKVENGNDAAPGGNICFVAEALDPCSFITDILFDSHGGSGSNGQSSSVVSTGGDGGSGEAGGNFRLLVGNIYSTLLRQLGALFGDITDRPATASSKLKAILSTIRRTDQLATLEGLEPRLQAIEKAISTGGSDAMRSSVQQLALRFQTEGDVLKNKLDDNVCASGPGETLLMLYLTCSSRLTLPVGFSGKGGQGHLGRGKFGSSGSNGTSRLLFDSGDPVAIRESSIILAHPDQCRMLLEKAKGLYFLNDLKALQDCHTLLSRLQDRLYFLDFLRPSDPLCHAYASSEEKLFIPSSRNPGKDNLPAEPASIESLRQISSEVQSCLRQVENWSDYYGRPANWVPRQTYKSFEDLTKKLLASALDAENRYKDYHALSVSQDTRRQKLEHMQVSCDKNIRDAGDTIPILQSDIDITTRTIEALTPELKQARSDLHVKIDADKDKFRHSFSFSFTDILDALSMFMFCPKPQMAVIQAAGVAFKAGTNVVDDQDHHVNTKYVVSQISQVEGTIDSLKEGYNARPDSHKVDIDDPGAAKLIAARDDMMKVLRGYSNVLGESNLEETQAMFDHYIGES
ncbi:hypothetical protein LTR70_001433 [Exophiala xenobiotica]|uniref:Uncharacterized protein n=1 Tax=Lithohypha guttulata TaxID=1690604 RepID=A0ABR0KM78_9EURO|nr:hypothetical protein LTR24_000813 [Lithohypha guttulata]KAK5328112.1 hypothetical protein LTR70_001433 [Exophiala xenobiotica]